MAQNFKIHIHRNSENLHLKIIGDFDGSSAHELLNALKIHGRGASRIFVHTNCLQDIHPFGCNVFHNNFDTLKRQSMPIVFTGENASQLAP